MVPQPKSMDWPESWQGHWSLLTRCAFPSAHRRHHHRAPSPYTPHPSPQVVYVQPFGSQECNGDYMEEKAAQLRRPASKGGPVGNTLVSMEIRGRWLKGVRIRQTRMGTVLEVGIDRAFRRILRDWRITHRPSTKQLALRIQTARLTTEADCSKRPGLDTRPADTAGADFPPLAKQPERTFAAGCNTTSANSSPECETGRANGDGPSGKWGDSEYAFAQVVMERR